MKNKFFSLQTILQFLFILIAFVLVAVLSTGFQFDWEKVLSWSFVVLVAIRLLFTLVTYNIVFGMDNVNRRQNVESKYFVTYATYKKKVNEIYATKRIEDLEKAVKEENKEEFIKASNKMIHKVTSRLCYDDINFDGPDIEAIAKKYRLSDNVKQKLEKTIQKILDGNVKYEELEIDDILIDKDEGKDKTPSKKFNFRNFLIMQNLMKSCTFLVTTVIMTVITFSGGLSNFWVELAKNATILLGGITSAIMLSYAYVKIRTSVLEQRNYFLIRRLGITAEYTQTKENVNILN